MCNHGWTRLQPSVDIQREQSSGLVGADASQAGKGDMVLTPLSQTLFMMEETEWQKISDRILKENYLTVIIYSDAEALHAEKKNNR